MSKKPTLVFLHGFLESSVMWNSITDDFLDFETVCIDLPGHGKAPVLSNNHTMELMADFTFEILNKKGINKAIFIGHSMGGYVALEFGKKYPSVVEGISLFFSTAAEDLPSKKIDRDRAAKIIEKNPTLFIKEAIPYLFTEKNKKRLASEIDHQIQLAIETKKDGIIACLAGMRDRPSNEYFLEIAPFPIQFIVGDKDPVISIESLNNQFLSQSIIDVEIIENCGHMGHLESNKECKKALRRFFEKITIHQ